MLRHELTSKTYPLQARLKLFEGTVTPTMLYACESWTLTKAMQSTLKRTQRRMLRIILGTPRRQTLQTDATSTSNLSTDDINSNTPHNNPLDDLITLTEQELLEPWPDFIRRATRLAEEAAARINAEDWVTTYWKRRWRWTQRVAGQPTNRWSRLAAAWDPERHERRATVRRPGGQRKRWDDDINAFLHSRPKTRTSDHNPHWLDLAQHRSHWRDLEPIFLAYVTATQTQATTDSNDHNHHDTQ